MRIHDAQCDKCGRREPMKDGFWSLPVGWLSVAEAQEPDPTGPLCPADEVATFCGWPCLFLCSSKPLSADRTV